MASICAWITAGEVWMERWSCLAVAVSARTLINVCQLSSPIKNVYRFWFSWKQQMSPRWFLMMVVDRDVVFDPERHCH
ncbi:hypothetical protein C8F04DRAFT_464023 [Mycena alexandri]|uniref:Uncharacterized protein n=1 Tax=Mycena alexandri TaxID=1745969 RepID=A0AAD6T3M4_9AGAR|nr:hypothetical protein C8F04DRAFT_464023 [Mycena alexandri]